MKIFKKVVTVFLVVALTVAFFTVAYAKNNNNNGKKADSGTETASLSVEMQALVEMGVIRGSGKDGVTLEYTKSKPTRMQGFVIYTRLINQAEECEQFAWQGADNFDDHAGYSEYAQKVMAYAKAHPELNWVGSNGKFSPMAHLTAKQYAKIMLVALGYEYDADFSWNNVTSFAGMVGLDIPKGAFTFEELAQMTYQTLYTEMKDSDVKLIDYLQLDDNTEDTTSPTVTDVVLSVPYTAGPPIQNGKVTVYFSEAMDVATLTDLANYTVDLDGAGTESSPVLLSDMAGASASAAANKMSVTLTIPGSALAGGTASGAGVTEITFGGLEDVAGNMLVTVTTYVRSSAELTVSSITAVGVNKIQVVFSNPMQTVDPSEFKLYRSDGTTLAAEGASKTIDTSAKIVTVTLDNTLTSDARAHADDMTTAKIVIGTAATKDIFGNSVSGAVAVPDVTGATPATVTIADKILPSLQSAETQDLDMDGYLDALKLTFSENVNDSTVAAADFDVTGYSGEGFVTGATANDAVIYITFAEMNTPDTGAMPAVTYTQGALTDLSGNKLATVTLTPTDKAAPAVITALAAGTLTAGEAPVSAALTVSESLAASSKQAVLDAVLDHIITMDNVVVGDISWTCVWTTDSLLTVTITANDNGGTTPDSITLSAVTADLIDATGNTAAAAQIIA